MATRKELIAAVGQRYREASKSERSKILDEFTELAQYHRKHAIRVHWSLDSAAPAQRAGALSRSGRTRALRVAGALP